jgi:hypothetical protein
MGWLGGKGVDSIHEFENQFSQMTWFVIDDGMLTKYSLLT